MNLTARSGWGLLLGGSLALLIGLLLIFGPRTEQQARADEQSSQLEFSALEPATPEVLGSLPKIVRERLAFQVFSLEGQLDRQNQSADPEASDVDLEISEYGEVNFPEGRVSLATIGDSVCAFFPYGTGICGERDEIAANGVVGFSPVGCKAYSLIGITPGNVARMTFDSDGDGEFETSVPVKSNVYAAKLIPAKTSAQGLDEAGTVVFEDVIPLNEFAATDQACQNRK